MTNTESVFAVMTVLPMTIEGGSEVVDTAVLVSTTVVLAVEVTNTVLPEIVESAVVTTIAVCELFVSTGIEADDPRDGEAKDELELGDCWELESEGALDETEGEDVSGEVEEEVDEELDEEVGEEDCGGEGEEADEEAYEEADEEVGEGEGGDRITGEVDTPDAVDDVYDCSEAVVLADDEGEADDAEGEDVGREVDEEVDEELNEEVGEEDCEGRGDEDVEEVDGEADEEVGAEEGGGRTTVEVDPPDAVDDAGDCAEAVVLVDDLDDMIVDTVAVEGMVVDEVVVVDVVVGGVVDDVIVDRIVVVGVEVVDGVVVVATAVVVDSVVVEDGLTVIDRLAVADNILVDGVVDTVVSVAGPAVWFTAKGLVVIIPVPAVDTSVPSIRIVGDCSYHYQKLRGRLGCQ